MPSSASSLRRSADLTGEPNSSLQSPSVTVSRHDTVNSRDTKHFVPQKQQPPQQQQQQKHDQKLSEPNLPSPSRPQKQMGSKRLVALAAALDAGELTYMYYKHLLKSLIHMYLLYMYECMYVCMYATSFFFRYV